MIAIKSIEMGTGGVGATCAMGVPVSAETGINPETVFPVTLN
jgi:hypothetical protein